MAEPAGATYYASLRDNKMRLDAVAHDLARDFFASDPALANNLVILYTRCVPTDSKPSAALARSCTRPRTVRRVRRVPTGWSIPGFSRLVRLADAENIRLFRAVTPGDG